MKEKAIHKRIGRKVLGYHRHFTKYLYERDTIFSTLWVFLFIIVLGSIPINFYILNPIKLALKGFDMNDLTYAKLGQNAKVPQDYRIVIVNIGNSDRQQLAALIEKTAEFKPKVMGLDVIFDGPKDPISDSIFATTISKQKNLVITNRIDWEDTAEIFKSQYFSDFSAYKGYANLVGDSKEERNTIRYYSPFEEIHGKTVNSFSAQLVQLYNDTAYKALVKRHKFVDLINYSRNTQHYVILEPEDLFEEGKVDSSMLRDKIVLLGYISYNPYDIEDKVFSPMNEKFVGKSIPDMNGIVVHANIISMVLDRNYIKKLPSWVNWLVAILICWLHMSFFIRYYLENHIWFHLVAKIAQLASAIIVSYLGIIMFSRYNVKLDMKMSLIVIIMAVDVIYFYEAFAVWLHKKYNYKTVFHQKHH